MSWRQVTVLALLLVTGLCCGLLGGKWDIALSLFTGAIGYAAPDRQPWKGQSVGGGGASPTSASPSE